jgi:type IV pilus assembly protein PilA
MPKPSSFLRTWPSRRAGFTWIEMIIILAVVGILAAMAIPSLQDQALKRQVKDGMALADVAKKGVQAIWSATGDMPKNNKDAGVPDKEKIVGSMIKEVSVEDGAVTLVYGNNASKALDGKRLTIRPAVVVDTPTVPIAWLCAQVSVPKGMEIRGKDDTDIQPSWLPVECRVSNAK